MLRNEPKLIISISKNLIQHWATLNKTNLAEPSKQRKKQMKKIIYDIIRTISNVQNTNYKLNLIRTPSTISGSIRPLRQIPSCKILHSSNKKGKGIRVKEERISPAPLCFLFSCHFVTAAIELLEHRFYRFVCRPANSSSRSVKEHPRNPSPHKPSISVLLEYCPNDVFYRPAFESIAATYTLGIHKCEFKVRL